MTKVESNGHNLPSTTTEEDQQEEVTVSLQIMAAAQQMSTDAAEVAVVSELYAF